MVVVTLTVDPKSDKPIYEQIVDGVKELILKGVLKENDPLPSVRNLAVKIEVNPNTVGKAYKEMEREKIIETVQGRGAFVAPISRKKLDKERLRISKEKLKPIVIEMLYANVNKTEIRKMLDEIIDELSGR